MDWNQDLNIKITLRGYFGWLFIFISIVILIWLYRDTSNNYSYGIDGVGFVPIIIFMIVSYFVGVALLEKSIYKTTLFYIGFSLFIGKIIEFNSEANANYSKTAWFLTSLGFLIYMIGLHNVKNHVYKVALIVLGVVWFLYQMNFLFLNR